MSAERQPANMRVLLEFRAGRMKLEEKNLVPESRKGNVRIVEDLEGMRHVQWGPQSDKEFTVEEDLIVLPEQADFRKVGPVNQRVYELKFRDKSNTLFFWMQENDAGKDEELTQSFNAIIHRHPGHEEPSPMQSTSSGRTTGVPNPAALAQMLSQIASSSSGGFSLASLQGQSLEQQAVRAAELLSQACGMPMRGVPKRSLGPSLSKILQPHILLKYAEQPGVLDRLAEYLPESQRSEEDLKRQCLSPQLHQQLKIFSAALLTGQFDPAALGLKVEGFTTVDFLNAIQKLVEQERAQEEKKE